MLSSELVDRELAGSQPYQLRSRQESKTVLYVVHTTIEPRFLMPRYQQRMITAAWKEHGDFVTKVRAQEPEFSTPYLALLRSDVAVIPLCEEEPSSGRIYSGGGVVVPINNGRVQANSTSSVGLDRFVAQCIEGKPFGLIGKLPRISSIVEFSPRELFPKAMERLAQRYDVKRFVVE